MLEGFIRSALASLGLTPEEAKERIDNALTDIRDARERVERVEEKLDQVLAKLEGAKENNAKPDRKSA